MIFHMVFDNSFSLNCGIKWRLLFGQRSDNFLNYSIEGVQSSTFMSEPKKTERTKCLLNCNICEQDPDNLSVSLSILSYCVIKSSTKNDANPKAKSRRLYHPFQMACKDV